MKITQDQNLSPIHSNVTVNQLWFAMTLIRDLPKINGLQQPFFVTIIHTHFDMTTKRQRLVGGKNYSQWRGSRKCCEYFSHTYKSWFTVCFMTKQNTTQPLHGKTYHWESFLDDYLNLLAAEESHAADLHQDSPISLEHPLGQPCQQSESQK